MNNRNLIYFAVYGKQDYTKLFNLLFVSLLFTNTNKSNFSLLVMTSPSLRSDIEKITSLINFGINVLVFSKHEKADLFEAAFARYHIFEFEEVNSYDKILYLDVDILINGELNEIFLNDLSNKTIYCLPEGDLNSDTFDSYGRSLFIELNLNSHLTEKGFTSGAILFRNDPLIRKVFEEVLSLGYENRKNGRVFPCLDQPFLNLLATSRGLVNLDLLPKYMINNPKCTDGRFLINHFSGGPGNFSSKLSKMSKYFLDVIRDCLPHSLQLRIFERLFSTGGEINEVIRLSKNLFLVQSFQGASGFLLSSPSSQTGLFVAVPSFEVAPVKFSEDLLSLNILDLNY